MYNSPLTKAYRILAAAVLILLLGLQVVVFAHAHRLAFYLGDQEQKQLVSDSSCGICEFIAQLQKQEYVAAANNQVAVLFSEQINPPIRYGDCLVLSGLVKVVNKGPPGS